MVKSKKIVKKGRKKRKFVGVTFKCCKVYSRIYIDGTKPKYMGWCPKCGAKMEFIVSPTGSKSKFFTVN